MLVSFNQSFVEENLQMIEILDVTNYLLPMLSSSAAFSDSSKAELKSNEVSLALKISKDDGDACCKLSNHEDKRKGLGRHD